MPPVNTNYGRPLAEQHVYLPHREDKTAKMTTAAPSDVSTDRGILTTTAPSDISTDWGKPVCPASMTKVWGFQQLNPYNFPIHFNDNCESRVPESMSHEMFTVYA